MPKAAIYPGTFDPLTNGHIDIIVRAKKLFPNLIVAVADGGKDTLFSTEDRLKMVNEALKKVKGVKVEVLSGLLTDFMEKSSSMVVVRGLRVISDFEYEFQMALMNRRLKKDFEVVFLPPSEEYSFLSSSLVKEVSSLGGKVRPFVPPNVFKALKRKHPQAR